jgi:hypothetical protein
VGTTLLAEGIAVVTVAVAIEAEDIVPPAEGIAAVAVEDPEVAAVSRAAEVAAVDPRAGTRDTKI